MRYHTSKIEQQMKQQEMNNFLTIFITKRGDCHFYCRLDYFFLVHSLQHDATKIFQHDATLHDGTHAQHAEYDAAHEQHRK